MPTPNEPDVTCKHGTAMDVHCCNCHSGFIFDKDHECPSVDEEMVRHTFVPISSGPENDDDEMWCCNCEYHRDHPIHAMPE